MLYSHSQTGYSLVEVLIAIAVLLLSIVGPLTIAAKSLQTAYDSEKRVVATFLAQEGIEAMSALRQDSVIEAIKGNDLNEMWDWASGSGYNRCTSQHGCNFDFSDDDWVDEIVRCNDIADCRLYFDEDAEIARYNLNPDSGDGTPFTRVIHLEEITTASNNDAVKVISTVSWDSGGFSPPGEVVLTTILFNVYEELQ